MATNDTVTYRQLQYDLGNVIAGGMQSDEFPYSLRQIGFWILNTRAELLSQLVSKGHQISDNYTQPISCADVELVDLSSCCNIKTECTAYRTAQRLPKPISGQYADLIIRAGGVNFIGPTFHIVAHPRVRWELDNKFTFNIPKAFLYDGYFYVVGQNLVGLKKINIEGVWEDPTDLARFVNCNGDPCFTDDSRFPVSRKMVETMKRMIKGTDLDILLNSPRDTQNDSNAMSVPVKVRTDKQTE